MRLLLDTSITLWTLAGDRRLSKSARNVIESATEVLVSAVTIWEISVKTALGKLEADLDDLLAEMNSVGFRHLALTWEHARRVRDLPPHHRDPFDRMLVAQAMSEPVLLLTSDSFLARYGDLVLVARR
ncbi:MAG TPA: type II toxin-antitoxin system VapC family toxin [Bauldia sp.]|nr:type II toxin-antitoxin system VapC family toxin [Bauldia sp.]